MDLGDVLSLIALASSIAALFLAWLERSNSLRVAVYTKQLEACIDIYRSLGKLDEELYNWHWERLDKKFDNRDVKYVEKLIDELVYSIEMHTLVLPNTVFLETQNLKTHFQADFKLMKANNAYIYKAKDRENMLLDYEDRVRDHFSIEKLTKEYRNMA